MNNSPLVSIITPYYNSDKYISETVESVIKQTYQNWEHIIVDDGSSDNSYSFLNDIAKQDKRIKIFKRDRLPKGRSNSRNIGVEKSEGKYIIFLDSDDLLCPHCLTQRVKIMEEGNFDFAVFQMSRLLPNGEYDGYMTSEKEDYLKAFLNHDFPWQTSCPIWNSSYFKRYISGGFNQSLNRLEDPELHIRALITSSKASFIVLPAIEYTDSIYRADYKPVDLIEYIEATNIFTQSIISLVPSQYKQELRSMYETVLAHYSGQNKQTIYNSLNKIQELNKTFNRLGIINKKMYKKTNLFLYLLKNKVFESRLLVFILNSLGFKNFYNLTFKDFYYNIRK